MRSCRSNRLPARIAIQDFETIMNTLLFSIHAGGLIGVDRLPGGKVDGHRPPFDAVICPVENRIQHRSQRDSWGSAHRFIWWQKQFDDLPFGIGQVAGIEHCHRLKRSCVFSSGSRFLLPYPLYSFLQTVSHCDESGKME